MDPGGRGALLSGHTACRERNALGTAIRKLAEAPDLERAASAILDTVADLLHVDHAMVVRIDHGAASVLVTRGEQPTFVDQIIPLTGALSGMVRDASATEIRGGGVAEIAVPIESGDVVWGAIVASGPSARMPQNSCARIAPFADLICLAATTFRDRSRLMSLAGTDPLTGLGNRRTFDALLATEVERASRHEDPLSLILLDIDHFKAVNDRYGHQIGDRVLTEVGRRLVSIARRGEAVTRIGGEEFAWLLPRTAGRGTEAAAERALRAISETAFEGVGRLTISAGACELAPGGSAEDMLRRADLMLYRAKAEGRNTVRRHAKAQRLIPTA